MTRALDERHQQLLRHVRANPPLLEALNRHRFTEDIEHFCRRFATTEPTAVKAYKKLVKHLDYRDRFDLRKLSLLSARQLFSSREAQVRLSWHACSPPSFSMSRS